MTIVKIVTTHYYHLFWYDYYTHNNCFQVGGITIRNGVIISSIIYESSTICTRHHHDD